MIPFFISPLTAWSLFSERTVSPLMKNSFGTLMLPVAVSHDPNISWLIFPQERYVTTRTSLFLL